MPENGIVGISSTPTVYGKSEFNEGNNASFLAEIENSYGKTGCINCFNFAVNDRCYDPSLTGSPSVIDENNTLRDWNL
jgi:hypothetical protein